MGSNPSDSTFALRSLKSEAGLFYKLKVLFQILYFISEGLRRTRSTFNKCVAWKAKQGYFINLKSSFKFYILFPKGFGGLGPRLINA